MGGRHIREKYAADAERNRRPGKGWGKEGGARRCEKAPDERGAPEKPSTRIEAVHGSTHPCLSLGKKIASGQRIGAKCTRFVGVPTPYMRLGRRPKMWARKKGGFTLIM